VIVHLAIELCASPAVVVLVGFHVGEDSQEGQVAAVHHDVLEDVGVAAFCRDVIRGQVLDLV